MKKFLVIVLGISCFINNANAQLLVAKNKFTHADTIRGSLNPERTWWDVLHYDIEVTPDYNSKTIVGKTGITYKVIAGENASMQIDLQTPLIIDSIFFNDRIQPGFKNEGNVWHVSTPRQIINATNTITIYYHGKPIEAKRPPWDGGWIWKKDSLNRPWMSVACQGLGASAWYPCKDYQGDEPDNGASLTITVPDTLVAVSNGRLKNKSVQDDLATYTWEVVNPINNYNIIPYVGRYVNFTDTFMGEKGKLDLSYWVLDYNLEKAKKQFEQVKLMLRAFEYWFGPYPFYEDGYKLVEAPHLGMEHQSAVAYGNGYKNGYRGNDLSKSGWGLKWDYIIVHESGHEWFANNITTKDIADIWVHEGFTAYSETLFTEYYYGKDAGNAYNNGTRRGIQNKTPVIGPYGVNKEGSGDMYNKGANLLQTIRYAIDDDEKWRQILRGLNKTFYHQTVTTKQVEDYISSKSKINFSKVFDQYLRTTQIPVLEYYYMKDSTIVCYRWNNCIDDFNLRLVLHKGDQQLRIKPTQQWKKMKLNKNTFFDTAMIDKNFYITIKRVIPE